MASTSAADGMALLKMNRAQRFGYNFVRFFRLLPGRLWGLIIKIGLFFKQLGIKIGEYFRNVVQIFAKGNWVTRLTYIVMGFSNLKHKQIARGVLFLLFEIAFIIYMIFVGGSNLGQLGSLGTVGRIEYEDPITGIISVKYVDNSFTILLYGVLTIFFIVALLVTWSMSIKQAAINQELDAVQKKVKSDKDDLRALVDQDFYKTLLALPAIGIFVFTVLPIVFMILVAFTNFDKTHNPPINVFDWVGFSNFAKLFDFGGSNFAATFSEILLWTLVWAFFATFTNYFLGMLVAMLINKKGIKFKKVWRTILIMTVTIPQFISLLYIRQLLAPQGMINTAFGTTIDFLGGGKTDFAGGILTKVMVIILNIWIGIPYLMLMVTGILMNIPADLYESAKIDGASPAQQYFKITLPYMLFVTGPYLLTSFTGNMNNFNVIFLLTGGGTSNQRLYNNAGDANLLITWLYSITLSDNNYALASVIGIMVFIVVAFLSLVVYNLLPSSRNEEDMS